MTLVFMWRSTPSSSGVARGGAHLRSRAGLAAARSRDWSPGARPASAGGLLASPEIAGAALTGPCHSRPLPWIGFLSEPEEKAQAEKPRPQSTLQRDY